MSHYPIIRITSLDEVLVQFVFWSRNSTDVQVFQDLVADIGSRDLGIRAEVLRGMFEYEVGGDVIAAPGDPGALALAVWAEIREWFTPELALGEVRQ